MGVRRCGPDRIQSPRAPHIQVGWCRVWWNMMGGSRGHRHGPGPLGMYVYSNKLELQVAAMEQFGGDDYEQGIKWEVGDY